MTQEAIIDDKGRIVISKDVRDSLGLKSGMKVKLHREANRIIIEKSLSSEEFIEKMEGFIKNDSGIPVSDPIDLKNIWERISFGSNLYRCQLLYLLV
jgi:AbrB family looped-hinge helix DNA binding protein